MKNIFLVLFLYACKAEPPVVMVAPRDASSMLLCLAEAQDLWESDIGDVNVVWTQTPQDAYAYFENNKSLFIFSNLSNYLPQLAVSNDLSIVSEVFNSTRGIRVVVKDDGSIGSARALLDKKIGYISGTASEIFLEYFYLTEGLNFGTVKSIPFELEAMKQAFNKGNISAMVIWEPELSRYKNQYKNIKLTEFKSIVHESKGVLLARNGDLEKNSNKIELILKSLIKAEQFYERFPVESLYAYHQCMGGDTDLNVLRESLADVRVELKLSHSLKLSYDRNRDWLIMRKLMTPSLIPVFHDVVQSKYLKNVRSRAVTLGSRE